jgi:hypothetical protein
MLQFIPPPRNYGRAFAVLRRCAALALSVLVCLWVAVVGANSQVTIGNLQIGVPGGGQLRIDSLSVEAAGYNPGTATLDDIMAKARSLGSTRADQVLEQLAALLEGARLGKFEIRGFSLTHPDLGQVNVAAMRLEQLNRGSLGAFVLEGVDVQSPHLDALKIERLAIKGLGFASLMRAAAAVTSGNTDLTALTGLGAVLEEIELAGFVTPHKIDDRHVVVERLLLKWGAFVGPIPTRLDLDLKMSAPIDPNNGEPTRALSAAGFNGTVVGLTANSAWTESGGQSTVALSFEVAGTRSATSNPAAPSPANAFVGLFSIAVKAAAENVSRALFNPDRDLSTAAAANVRAGPMEITLRDTGGFNLGLATVVREVFNSVKDAPPGSQRARLRTALSAFLDGPGATLTVKIATKEQVTIKTLVDRLSQRPDNSPNAPDPYEIFNIEASTAR